MGTRVLIADSSPLCLYGLDSLLSRDPGIEVVATAADGETAVRLALSLQPDVLLSEIDLPRLRGIAALVRVRQTLPAVRAVFLTAPDNLRWRDLAAEAGASAFLTKDADVSILAAVIRNVHAGRSYLRQTEGARVGATDTLRRDTAHWRSLFSDREIFVLRQIVQGRTSREIGAMLRRSHRTIDKQRESLRVKLDIHNSAELAAFGILFLRELDLLGNGPEEPPAP